ncbi:hypothetical protein, partial [Streptomyces sp. NPDC006668]|uniref:hypothetical protein n=1 Tax=Streptomyces sp. NPDC006668 TaxID=3156903 RepID=UPI00340F23A2
ELSSIYARHSPMTCTFSPAEPLEPANYVEPGMELDDPGFHHSVLADFRDRLTEGDRADRLLDLALARLKEAASCGNAPPSAQTPPMSWPVCVT